jgi:ABC-type glycerol-3-phosphate transport system permease component
MMNRKPGRIAYATMVGILTCIIIIVSLFPIIWALSTSIKGPAEVFATPPTLFPRLPTIQNYIRLLKDNFTRFVLNSTVYTVMAIGLALFLSTLCSYVLARTEFKGKNAVVLLFLMTLITPYMAVLIPMLFLLTKLRFTNTRLTLPVIYAAQSIPFVAWFLKGYFEGVPDAMEKAALVDGYSRLQVLYKILFPVSMPAIISVSVFVALTSWNDYIVAIFMLSSSRLQTLPVAMFFYLGTHGREWGPLSAAAIVSIVPIVSVFVIFRKYFLGGMLSGAIKG